MGAHACGLIEIWISKVFEVTFAQCYYIFSTILDVIKAAMVLTLEFNNIFYHGCQKNLVKLFCFIVFFHSVNGPPPSKWTVSPKNISKSLV
jgi:hypothetical protein